MPKHHHTNRLVNEKSPYLLQHAHNPVDWYPWGEEAFQEAKFKDKPIFLSIGYATCHWCHTMESESFEDPEIAALMNKAFVNIKVDREELPEVDSLYMEFAQSMMSGSAGWPLNVILTPKLQPFFAITYLPPRETEGMMGLADLIHRIEEVWQGGERERVFAQAEKIVEVFQDSVHTKGELLPHREVLNASIEILFKMSDPVFGGIKGSPKFPVPFQSNLLLRYSFLENESRALFIVEKTLDMMHRGGIYDHLGGGFSRYSVDEEWLIPHFEKMLYDNALLIFAYLEAWKLTRRDLYREVCEETIRYVLREMTSPEGGFYTGQDSDSEGVEGLYYTWTPDEVNQVLGAEDGAIFCAFYDVTKEGNFEGRNVLHTPQSPEEFVEERELDLEEFQDRLKEMKHEMLKAREKRVAPLKDDKVLGSSNGMMIYSLIEAGVAFNNKSYIDHAVGAAKFIRKNLWQEGRLLRRWREGDARFPAGLDEYAYMIRAVLSLFEAGQGVEWLEWAVEMTEILKDNYKCQQGGYYQTDGTDPNLILRKCQFSDGAEPSGNAIHCENLLRLYQITAEAHYLDDGKDILKAVEKYLKAFSAGYSYHLLNLLHLYDRKAPAFVVVLNQSEDSKTEISKEIFSAFLPHRTVVWRREGEESLFELVPSVRDQKVKDGRTTVYLCRGKVCEDPITDLNKLRSVIERT